MIHGPINLRLQRVLRISVMISFSHFMIHNSLIYFVVILCLISQSPWKVIFLSGLDMYEGKSGSKLPYFIPGKQMIKTSFYFVISLLRSHH